jgi:hypothetical protein
MIFGRQRPPRDLAALILLSAGFSALAVAIWFLRDTWAGGLVPLTFFVGSWAGLRAEVRELELRDDSLIVRTFLRSYSIPREHITAVVMTAGGPAIDVLSGARYTVSPPDTDADEVFRGLTEWHASGPAYGLRMA